MVRAFLSAVLIIFAALAVAAYVGNLPYWVMPPPEKFAAEWRRDLDLLEKSGKFPEAWNNLSEIQFNSNDTQVQEWYKKTGSPFGAKKDGAFKLDVLGVHFIEGNRYGVIIQYNWIDTKSGNTVGEISRKLKLGLYY